MQPTTQVERTYTPAANRLCKRMGALSLFGTDGTTPDTAGSRRALPNTQTGETAGRQVCPPEVTNAQG